MSKQEQQQSQIKSRQRVADHGEVFTNPREVNAMLDLVTSMVFATTYGIGIIFAAPILFCSTAASSSPPATKIKFYIFSNFSNIITREMINLSFYLISYIFFCINPLLTFRMSIYKKLFFIVLRQRNLYNFSAILINHFI